MRWGSATQGHSEPYWVTTCAVSMSQGIRKGTLLSTISYLVLLYAVTINIYLNINHALAHWPCGDLEVQDALEKLIIFWVFSPIKTDLPIDQRECPLRESTFLEIVSCASVWCNTCKAYGSRNAHFMIVTNQKFSSRPSSINGISKETFNKKCIQLWSQGEVGLVGQS